MTFQIYRDKAVRKEWRWRLRYADEIIAASGDGHETESACRKEISLVQESDRADIVVIE